MDRAKLQRIKRGDPIIQEPGLEDLLREGLSNGTLQFAHPDDVAVEQRDVVLVAVGTPSMPDGSCDVSYVQSAITWAVAKSKGPTIITMKSSLPPGTGLRLQESELTGTGCHYVANPEFLQQGTGPVEFVAPNVGLAVGPGPLVGREGVLFRPLAVAYRKPQVREAPVGGIDGLGKVLGLVAGIRKLAKMESDERELGLRPRRSPIGLPGFAGHVDGLV